MEHFKVGYIALACSRVFLSRDVYCLGVVQTWKRPFHLCQTLTTTGETMVIRVPLNMRKQIENVKQIRSKKKIDTTKAGKLMIHSKNPQLNQAAGYILGKFEEPHLSSKGWKHKKSFGDYFTINATKAVAPFIAKDKHGENLKDCKSVTFRSLNICKQLVDTLSNANITSPTSVQQQTIPEIMKGNNILCAAETGSGKTLCYLLPVIQRLQREKTFEDSVETSPKIGAVIIVPARELADQVAAVAKTLCAPFGLQTKTVGGGRGIGHIKMVFKRGLPDILVATPGALVKALRRNCLDMSELSFLVVDEADTMFDPSFSGMLESILLRAQISSGRSETQGPAHKAQLLVVGATFPGGVGEILSQVTDLGNMVTIKSNMLHFLMPHVKQTFLKVKGADKLLELHQAVKLLQAQKEGGGGGGERSGSVLVFCNKASTVNWLGYALDEMGVQHVRLQGEMPASVRAGIFRSFQNGKSGALLVCTDIASRGLDTTGVRMVVNYDVPESTTDYIHRAGRVGRAGSVRDGEVLSFVTHPWDVELVQVIETAARRRTVLPGLKSAISKPQPKAEGMEE